MPAILQRGHAAHFEVVCRRFGGYVARLFVAGTGAAAIVVLVFVGIAAVAVVMCVLARSQHRLNKWCNALVVQ